MSSICWTEWRTRLTTTTTTTTPTTDEEEAAQDAGEKAVVEEMLVEAGGGKALAVLLISNLVKKSESRENKVAMVYVMGAVAKHSEKDDDFMSVLKEKDGFCCRELAKMLERDDADDCVVVADAIGCMRHLDFINSHVGNRLVKRLVAMLQQGGGGGGGEEDDVKRRRAEAAANAIKRVPCRTISSDQGEQVRASLVALLRDAKTSEMGKRHAAEALTALSADFSTMASRIEKEHGSAARQGLADMMQQSKLGRTKAAGLRAIEAISTSSDSFGAGMEEEHRGVIGKQVVELLMRESHRAQAAKSICWWTWKLAAFATGLDKEHGGVVRRELVRMMMSSDDAKVKAAGAYALGELAKQIGPSFVEALDKEIGGREVRRVLIGMLQGEEWKMQKQGAFALHCLASQSSIFAIALHEEHGVVVRRELMIHLRNHLGESIARAISVMSRKVPAFGVGMVVEHPDVREVLERMASYRSGCGIMANAAAQAALEGLDEAEAEMRNPMIKSAAKRARTDDADD